MAEIPKGVEDIAPEILESIEKDFANRLKNNKTLIDFKKLLEEGKADYKALQTTAHAVGNDLAKSFRENISKDILPNGKMYYNIAQKVVDPMLIKDYNLIADMAVEVQTKLNQNVGIKIKAQKPPLNQDKVDGLVNKLTSYDDYDKAKYLLGESVINFTESVVDDAVKENALFHAKSGIKATIERIANSEACDYCAKLVGEYTYPEVPDGVYSRHRACRCLVSYTPGNGKRQDVHSKKWIEPNEYEKIKARKNIGKNIIPVKEIVERNLQKLPVEVPVKERVAANLEKNKSKKFIEQIVASEITKVLNVSTDSKVKKILKRQTKKAKYVDISDGTAYYKGDGIIGINLWADKFNDYPTGYLVVHELAHMADDLEIYSWRNKKFIESIKKASNYLEKNKEEIENWFSVGGKYEKDLAFHDIISALSKGELNYLLEIGHTKEYWKDDQVIAMEVFANITAIKALNLASIEELNKSMKDLNEAYEDLI